MIKNNQNIPQRSCFSNSAFFEKGFTDGFRFYCRNTPEVLSVLSALLPNPDEAFNTGKILKEGTRTHGGIVSFSEKSYYLKRYNDMGFWYRLRHLFKPSRAIRTWKVGWDFYKNNVPVPEPLICLEERRYLFLHHSYILMEHVEKAERLDTSWPTLSTDQKVNLIELLARILKKMHAASCVHGDLKWSNILTNESEKDIKLTLVDLDSCSCSKLLVEERARKDVKLFLRWLKHYERDHQLLKEFLKLWEQHYRNSSESHAI